MILTKLVPNKPCPRERTSLRQEKISCADSAREEVASLLLSEPEPKKSAQKMPRHAPPAPPRTTCEERQRVLEQNKKDAYAAQKIVDAQKEKAILEEENKKLKAQLEKAKSVPDPILKLPRPK